MAEKKIEDKAEKKEARTKKAEKNDKKSVKKADIKKTDTKKKAEIKTKADLAKNTKRNKEKPERKNRGGIICAVLVTFFVTALLFGMAFFVFMNLDVISDHGRVRIERGKIYIDNRHSNCVDVVEDNDREQETASEESADSKKEEKSFTSARELVDNPNARVSVKGAQLIEIGDLELYLPKNFEASRANGNGKYVYNLADNEGWADVKIYAEKTTADLLAYMQKKDSLLRLTNSSYYMNGTSWAEMESGSSIAYGTRLGNMLYVVILNVKLESDATGEAEQMIPKTIRLKRIYK